MKQSPWLAFSIDRRAKAPIFEQICSGLRSAIIAGELTEGTRLPPTRAFATELGVSRSTVVTAYEQLVAEGYLSSRQGSGYRVCAMGEVERLRPARWRKDAAREGQAGPPRPFEPSQPDMRLFPYRQWARAVSRLCRTDPRSMLEGGSRLGNAGLRAAIADHVAQWRGIDAAPGQIIVTAGATDALEICLRTLAEAGNTIALEDPGYPPTRHFARAHGLLVDHLDIDAQGARVPPPASAARLAVLTPSHQYPLGGAMSPGRRLEFLAWAREHDGWIIEDDYDSEFRYAGRPIPAMAGFDQLDRTIYVGSFSKIFSNSLRLGYIVAPEALMDRLAATLGRFGPKASYMPQPALAAFMQSGEFYRHLRRVRRIYGERRKFLIERLRHEFSDHGHVVDHQAGMQLVFHLADGLDDADIARRAAARGVCARPLSAFSIRDTGHNGLILGFCGFSEDEMAPALDVLKACIAGR